MLQLLEALKGFNKNIATTVLQSEILNLTKHWDVIRKVCLQYCQVLIPDDQSSNGDDGEDINEGEDAKVMTGKVGAKEHREHCKNCPGCIS